ncbi:hypothetical protein [Compostibacter hankyongensis]|uniref:DUF922 domain-containing protein n=1 Tax=Compostibacter hankyongensis TaxID=1007089 RepID=A0ABP8FM44_9BACT
MLRMLLLIPLLLTGLRSPAQDSSRTEKPPPKVLIIRFDPDYAPAVQPEDTIYYTPSRPLQWSDFTGKRPPGHTDNIAVTYSSFAYTGSARQKQDTLWVTLTLQVFFVKSASWVSGSPGTYALQHEQMHFDLTHIAADDFKRRVLRTDMEPEDADSYIQYQYLEAFRDMNHLQERYEAATGHGRNPAAAAQWKKYIRDRLYGKLVPLPDTGPSSVK